MTEMLIVPTIDERMEYDENNNLIHYKNSAGHEYWNEYDENNNKIHYKTAGGIEESYKYDSNGNLIYMKRHDSYPLIGPEDYECWTEYDENNNEIYLKNSNGLEMWKQYNSNGKLTLIKYNDGREERYDYDSNGNLIHKINYDTNKGGIICQN